MNLKKIKDSVLPDVLEALPVQYLKYSRISTPFAIKKENPTRKMVTYIITNNTRRVTISYARGDSKGRYYLNGKRATVAEINSYLIKIFRTN